MQKTMDDFIQLTKEDCQRAKALFFSESFKSVYLKNETELEEIYHQLLLGRNKEQIFDEFLIYLGAKQPVSLGLRAEVLSDEVIVTVTKKVAGYAQGKILLEGYGVSLVDGYLYHQSFQDDKAKIVIKVTKESTHKRTCRIRIQLPRGEFAVDFLIPAKEQSPKEILEKDLTRLYVKFCRGMISKDYFVAEGKRRLEVFSMEQEDHVILHLLSLHFDILQGDEGQIEEAFSTLDIRYEKELTEPLCKCYDLYLKALYGKSEGRIQKATKAIQEYVDNESENTYPLWMLCYLDERLMNHPERKIKHIKSTSRINGLLAFEVCSLYGQDVTLCQELGEFEYEVLSFGLHYECLLPKVWLHVNHLVKKTKEFQAKWLSFMVSAYEQTQIEELLQSVCVLLIRGNYMSPAYHMYYAKAVEANVKVIGLLEAYIATIPKGEYPVLDQDVLLYFTYSNSLNHTRLANLYANIVKNRWKYDGIYEQYRSKIQTFLVHQLSQGNISEDLIFLYHAFFETLSQDLASRISLGNLLFYERISRIPAGIHHVLVAQKELRENVSTQVKGGIAYVNVLGEHPRYLFADQDENRYLKVDCNIKPIWSKKEIEQFEKSGSMEDENHLIKESIELFHKEELTKDELLTVQRILACQQLDEKYQHKILEKVLNYYFTNKEFDKIHDNLPLIHLEYLTKENCSRIIELFIEEEQYEEALAGIERFGVMEISKENLKKVTLWDLTTKSNRLDETLLILSEAVFLQGIYNNEIMGYLQQFYYGNLEFMVRLWEKGNEFGLTNQEFMKRLLEQGKKEHNLECLLGVFSAYARLENIDTDLVGEILHEYVVYGYENHICFEEVFYELLGQQIEVEEGNLLNQWIFLDYYKDKPLNEIQKRQVKVCAKYQIANGRILPILFEFSSNVMLPIQAYNQTYIVYQEAKDRNVTFHMVRGDGSQIDIPMKEMLPGYYVCTHTQFADDIVDSFVTLPRQQNRRRKDIQWIQPEHKKDKGRFYLLNEMLQNQRDSKMLDRMKQYAYEKSMIDDLEETDDSSDTF